ncbi:MAG: hypothetical protein LIO85_03230 [Rikenellaceae bacterium]|nr:hypothetical protein [Rikenellaceae bacterium]
MNESYVNELDPRTDDQTPKGIETETLETPETFLEDNGPVREGCPCVTQEEIDESVIEINPDVNSMESRG